jgi:hypothetical protein
MEYPVSRFGRAVVATGAGGRVIGMELPLLQRAVSSVIIRSISSKDKWANLSELFWIKASRVYPLRDMPELPSDAHDGATRHRQHHRRPY